MLVPPGSVDSFLARHWQKHPLFIPQAVERLRPAVSRNELAWLATLDDVESRLVFTRADGDRTRYTAETGPFDAEYLAALPKRGWTLLVHDVEKHLPALRRLFALVPFIPDWRIDDLMVSFAAPGGGVGPHTDNYDVFLCQGTGVREWRVSDQAVPRDSGASDELALIHAFEGDLYMAREGDVLYLPPGIAHWGTAQRACMTYSIGMRAPQLSDLDTELPDSSGTNPFYGDADLSASEVRPGYISPAAIARAAALLGGRNDERDVARTLGRFVTTTKQWLTPDSASQDECARLPGGRLRLRVHGMARVAWDDCNVYVNGRHRELAEGETMVVEDLCCKRVLRLSGRAAQRHLGLLEWMLEAGTFELPGK